MPDRGGFHVFALVRMTGDEVIEDTLRLGGPAVVGQKLPEQSVQNLLLP